LWRQGDENVELELTTSDNNTIIDRKQIFTFLGDNTKIIHHLFYAKTRRSVFNALNAMVKQGWTVIPIGAF
jgi:hypothetical protein